MPTPDPDCPETNEQSPEAETSEDSEASQESSTDEKPERTRPRFDYVKDTNDPLAGIDD